MEGIANAYTRGLVSKLAKASLSSTPCKMYFGAKFFLFPGQFSTSTQRHCQHIGGPVIAGCQEEPLKERGWEHFLFLLADKMRSCTVGKKNRAWPPRQKPHPLCPPADTRVQGIGRWTGRGGRVCVSGAVDELVFQAACGSCVPSGAWKWTTCCARRLPAVSVYQTPGSENTQPATAGHLAWQHGIPPGQSFCVYVLCIVLVCFWVRACATFHQELDLGVFVRACVRLHWCVFYMSGEETSSWGLMSYNEV